MTMVPARPRRRRSRAVVDVPPSPRTIIVCLFTAGAMAAGGGGSSAPFSELVVQLLAAVSLAAWFVLPAAGDKGLPVPRAVVWLCAILLILPVMQLIPLPPAIWQALPGRESEWNALALISRSDAWMPWSVAPARTFASLLAIVPPVIALVMTATLAPANRRWVIATIALMGIASVLLGGLQLSAGRSGMWRLYSEDNLGFLNGFQANRNAEADVLLIALVAVAAATHLWRDRFGNAILIWTAAGLSVALVAACVLTGSRTGITLIPVALLFSALIWRADLPGEKRLPIYIAAGCIAMAASYFVLRSNLALGRVVDRFSFEGDFRSELWKDTLPTIAAHFPFGSGVGTFRTAFLPFERLEVVDQTWPVRAHNDFLELALEGGLFGVALLVVAVAIVGLLIIRAWRTKGAAEKPVIFFATATMVNIALHSVVDYPLRSMALAHLAAVAAGLLATAARERATQNEMELADA